MPGGSLSAAGMVLLGHLHTHEFAAGGTTDQVGNPWASSAPQVARAAARRRRWRPHGSRRHRHATRRDRFAFRPRCCGTSAIKPTRGRVSMAGVVPLGVEPRSRRPDGSDALPTVVCCSPRWPAPTRPRRERCSARRSRLLVGARSMGRLGGVRLGVSPRAAGAELDADVAAGFELASRPVVGSVHGRRATATRCAIWRGRGLPRRPDDRDARLPPPVRREPRALSSVVREWVELGERRAVSGEGYVAAQVRRREQTAAWAAWFDEHRLAAIVEPTIPVVAPLRGNGYEHAGSDYALISLAHLWDWTGFPVAAFPAGVGRSGLPVGVSLIGPAGSDWGLVVAGDRATGGTRRARASHVRDGRLRTRTSAPLPCSRRSGSADRVEAEDHEETLDAGGDLG